MIIYQLYIDKFNKTLKGLTEKLDYLVDLGVDTLWIMPHYPSPMVDGGYDVSNYTDIRSSLGTIDDFKILTTAAHSKGLKVVVDLVLNHTSTEHPWFKTARNTKNNDKRDYYIWNNTSTDMLAAVNAFPNIKLTNWVYNPFTKDYYFATFYPLQPDLNWDSPGVLEEFKKILSFWINLGVDGFRLDAMTHLVKRHHTLSVGLPETHNIIKKIRSYIDSINKDIVLIGESDMHSYKSMEYFGNGDECHYLFDFEGSVKLLYFLFDTDQQIVKDILQTNRIKPENTDWIYFLGTHDTINTDLLDTEKKEKLLLLLDPNGKYMKTHDSRAALRIAEIFNGDKDKIIKAHELLFSLPGSKVIYYGDEIGTRNVITEEYLIDNRYEVRAEFNWDELSRQIQDNNSLFSKIKTIIHNAKHQEQKFL